MATDDFVVAPGDGGTSGPSEPNPDVSFELAPELQPAAGPDASDSTAGGRNVVRRGTSEPQQRRPGVLALRRFGQDRAPGSGRRREELDFGERPMTAVEQGKGRLAAEDAAGRGPQERTVATDVDRDELMKGAGKGRTFAPPGQAIQEIRELLGGGREKVSPETTRSVGLAGLTTALLTGFFGG